MNREERRARGRAERKAVPRSLHAGFTPPPDRPDPLVLVAEQNLTRIPQVVPVRWGRMAQSPFAWLRGSPIVMAADLAATAATSLTVQLCGDAHLLNFGLFAAPDRRQIFDVNDFDETLRGPFEWDVKRLAASLVVAARLAGFPDDVAGRSVLDAVRTYRSRMAGYAAAPVLDVWYETIDYDDAIAVVRPEHPETLEERATRARSRTSLSVLPKLTEQTPNGPRIRDRPPLVRRLFEPDHVSEVAHLVERYRASVADELRPLVDRFRLVDLALKVVGVGSVGTRCFVALLEAGGDEDPLFLQVKEAQRSVLERHLDPSPYATDGERVVRGQRMMQAAGDVLLGWFHGGGRSYYVRQLRDMKASVNLEAIEPEPFVRYGGLCGWALARSHARTGDPAAIAGYLGSGTAFDDAILAFATDYAQVTELDHTRLVDAIAAGEIVADDH